MRKITFLFLLFLSFWSGFAQFGCGSGVILTDGYTANGITTPGAAGAEDWNTNPTGTSINGAYWDDDVYLFEYTSGTKSEKISMTIFSRKSWNGIGIFSSCSGTTFSGELDAKGTTSSNSTKTVSTIIAPSTTVYIAIGQWGTPNGLDFDVIDFSVSTCFIPENVQNTSVTTTTGDFSWDSEATATTGYNWVVMADGDDPMVDTPIANGSVAPGSTTVNVTGLSSNTDYDFYVQSDCGGGDLSNWSSVVSFLTNCSVFLAPVTENFNDASNLNCWVEADSGIPSAGPSGLGSSAWVIDDFLNNNNYTDAFRVNLFSDSKEEWLISPEIDLASNAYYLKYFVAETDSNNSSANEDGGMASTDDEVQVLITTDGGSTWQNLTTYNSANVPPLAGKQEALDLSSYSGVIQIAFWASEGTNNDDADYDFFIDDFSIDSNSCLAPYNLTMSNLTATDVDFNWVDGNSTPAPNGYNWVVMADGDDPNIGTPIQNGAVVAGVNTANITGLLPNTDYDFYVQSDCGGGDISDWSVKMDFLTQCGIEIAPYTENFTDPNIPDCWEQDSAGDWDFQEGFSWNTTGCSATPDDHTGNSGSFAAVDMTDTSNGTSVILEMPLVDISSLTKPALYFYMFMCTQGYSPANELYIDAYDGTTWNQVGVVNTGSASWEEHVFLLAPYAVNDIVQLRFRSEEGPTGNTFYGDIAIDDVTIDEGPACTTPTNIMNNGISSTSVAYTWDPVPSAIGYDWVVMADGDDPLTDTPVASGSTTAANNRVVVSGLNSSTDYDFYVRADCGNGDLSDWSSKANFTTECAIINAPFFDDVEIHNATTTFNESECWYTVQTSYGWDISDDDTPSSDTGPNQAYSGTNFFFTEGSSGSAGDVAELYSPTIDVSSLTAPALMFYYHMFNGDTPGDMGELHVDVYAGNSWNNDVMPPLVGTQQTAQADPWIEKIVDLSSYTGTIQVRFRAIRGNDYESDISLDDISLGEMPTCFSPTNVQVTNTTGNTADFSWDAETTATNGYIWVVMADGDDPNTGTPIASGTTPAGTTSANVTGLSASTDYDFYVKSDCGGGDESDWASGLDFQTPCATFPAPYVENFDSTSIPNCWSQDSAGDWDFQEGFTWNTTGCSATPDDHTGNSGSFAAVDMTDTSAGTAAILEMPLVDVSTLTTPSLSFYMFMCTQGYSPANELYIDVYDGTTWNQVGVINSGSAAWEEHIFDLTSHVSNNTVKLRFRSLEGPTGNTFYGDIAIDDVRIDELPTCFDPINIQLNSYTATTADFSWDAEPTATNGYNWVVMADGDDPNVDTPVASGSVPAGTLTANVTGLSADTDYDFYVKSDCGAGDLSRWSLVFDFTTYPPCAAPTNVQNTAISDSTAEFTWDVSADESEGYNWVVMADGDDPNTNSPFTAGSVASGITIANVTGLDDNTDYDFYVRSNCGNGNLSEWSIMVDFKTDFGPCVPPTAINTGVTATTADFQWLISVDESDGYNWVVMVDGDDPSTDTPVKQGSVPNGTTTLTVSGLSSKTKYDFYLQSNCGDGNIGGWSAVVNFTTKVGPCGVPTAIATDNVTENSATFSWTNPAEQTTGYVWKVVANGGDPSTNTPVAEGYLQSGTNSVKVTGLLSNISYDFYIKSDCGNANVSDWSSVLDFITEKGLGVNDIAFQSLSLYPNPVKSNLTISAKSNVEQLELFSLLGQKVKTLSPNSTQTQLDLSGLSSGTYLLKVTINDSSKTFRIIKE